MINRIKKTFLTLIILSAIVLALSSCQLLYQLADPEQLGHTTHSYAYDDIEVMEERLYERFKSDSTPEREERLSRRLLQNRADYLEIFDTLPHIYAFTKNSGTPTDTAKAVIDAITCTVRSRSRRCAQGFTYSRKSPRASE